MPASPTEFGSVFADADLATIEDGEVKPTKTGQNTPFGCWPRLATDWLTGGWHAARRTRARSSSGAGMVSLGVNRKRFTSALTSMLSDVERHADP